MKNQLPKYIYMLVKFIRNCLQFKKTKISRFHTTAFLTGARGLLIVDFMVRESTYGLRVLGWILLEQEG